MNKIYRLFFLWILCCVGGKEIVNKKLIGLIVVVKEYSWLEISDSFFG